MQNPLKSQIFRNFYANDWNQPESKAFCAQASFQITKTDPFFPQLRKKCVKSEIQKIRPT